MGEHHRVAPGHWLLRRANGAIFVAICVLHKDRADQVGAQLARQVAPRQPFALEVATNFWAVSVDRAAAAGEAIDAFGARGLLEIVDLQRRTAHRACPAGFPWRRRHSFLAPPPDSGRYGGSQHPYHYFGFRERRILNASEYRANADRNARGNP